MLVRQAAMAFCAASIQMAVKPVKRKLSMASMAARMFTEQPEMRSAFSDGDMFR